MSIRLLVPKKTDRDKAASALLAHAARPERHAEPAAAIGGFDFPANLVGKSAWLGSDGKPVTVYYDPATGAQGLKCAQYVVSKIDYLMTGLDNVFGVRGLGGNVIICAVGGFTNGDGGAYHYGCGFGSAGGDWYEDVSADQIETFGLVMAEVCESYMGLQNRGWNCGGSGGEGLSRFLAEIVSNGAEGSLGGYSSGASWDGVTDWISRDQGTDGDYPSIGCSVLYMWWMTQLGYTPAQIVQAGEPDGTLATNYAALTGKPHSQAFADFKAAVQAVGGPTGDNPWHAATPVLPSGPTPPPPPPPPPPGPPPPTPVPTGHVVFPFHVRHLIRKGGSITDIPARLPVGDYVVATTAPAHEKEVRVMLSHHSVDPEHHDSVLAEAQAAGISLSALLQLLQTASPILLALIQSILNSRTQGQNKP